ncbi:protein FAM50A-like [Schistocerca gregaria]|uniref:protein FAM50A-like n=1 Tax=Schistocerca gregaria TaxID=7010 RepID=UPI00211F1EF6|nr:protein FAM50A-like [Schistocerca gregaria]
MKQGYTGALKPVSGKSVMTSSTIENQLKRETIGLETLDSFTTKRQNLILEGASIPSRPEKKRKECAELSKLSFVDEESEDGTETFMPVLTKRILKDPSVDTSFLPDRDRDEKERQERLKLKKEWLAAQEKIKAEKINITYSYYDGTGHRRSLVVTKGTKVDEFLSQVRREFRQLRNVATDHLMFIKEDLIIPPNYSFYELIETKARGKSGPLFYWDAHDDIRYMNDASMEKEESHAAKVVEKRCLFPIRFPENIFLGFSEIYVVEMRFSFPMNFSDWHITLRAWKHRVNHRCQSYAIIAKSMAAVC